MDPAPRARSRQDRANFLSGSLAFVDRHWYIDNNGWWWEARPRKAYRFPLELVLVIYREYASVDRT